MSANLQNSIESLRRELRKIKCSKHVDYQALLSGDHHAFVSLYRLVICEYSVVLIKHLLERGYELTGTSDYKFMEILYKILRDLFSYRPKLSVHQFFSSGYRERKLDMASEIISHIIDYLPTITPPSAAVRAFNANSLNKLTSGGRRRRVSSGDGIEIHEYGDLSTQPAFKQRPTSANTSSKSTSTKSVSRKGTRGASPSRGGGLGISAPRSRSASNSNSPGRSGLKKSSSFTIGRSKTSAENTVTVEGNITDDEGNQLHLLNQILDSNDSDRRPNDQSESNMTASWKSKKPSYLAGSELDAWEAPMGKQIHDSVLKIASQLENILARVTLVETRIQTIEDTIAAKDDVSVSNMSQLRPHSAVVNVVESPSLNSGNAYYSKEVIPSSKLNGQSSISQPKLYQGSLQTSNSLGDVPVSRPYSSIAGVNRSIPSSTFQTSTYEHRPATSVANTDKDSFRKVMSSPVSVSISSSSPYERYSTTFEGGRPTTNGNSVDYRTTSPYLGDKTFGGYSWENGYSKSSSAGSKPPTGGASYLRSRSPSPLPPTYYQTKFTLNLLKPVNKRVSGDEKNKDGVYQPSDNGKESGEVKAYSSYNFNDDNKASVGESDQSRYITDKENVHTNHTTGSTPPNTYRSQADRIAAMLADTQTLLVNK